MTAKQEVIPPPKRRAGARMRSPRYYVAMMDAIFNQACRGERSPADAQRLHQMAQAGLEAHLNLVLLNEAGANTMIDVAPAPEEGFIPPPVRQFRQKKIVAKRGIGRHGQIVDETTVSISSNAEDEDAEGDAEIEALT